jgi:serine/threonine protein kinase
MTSEIIYNRLKVIFNEWENLAEVNSSLPRVFNEINSFDILLGTYGDVFRVRHRITGEIYALKQIRDEHEANGIPATAMREAAILKQLNHENIIKLEDVFLTDERCYFLLEYMDEDLKRYLDKNRPLDRRTIQVKEI